MHKHHKVPGRAPFRPPSPGRGPCTLSGYPHWENPQREDVSATTLQAQPGKVLVEFNAVKLSLPAVLQAEPAELQQLSWQC